MPFAHINDDISIYYEVTGTGDPIVFIHPPGMGLVTFRQQLPLTKNYQVITFDCRGNGKSGSNNEKVTIPLLASDLLKLLDHLQIKKIVVCGYSNGGSVALEFALSYPDRVKGIITLGGFPEVSTFLLKSEFKLGLYTVKMKGLSVLAKVLGASHGVSKGYKKEIEEYVKKADVRTLYQMYNQGHIYKCTDRLPEIKVPTLLIDGARDHYLHKYQKILSSRIKNSDLVFISKARHQLPTRHHKEVNAVISNFMNKIG